MKPGRIYAVFAKKIKMNITINNRLYHVADELELLQFLTQWTLGGIQAVKIFRVQ